MGRNEPHIPGSPGPEKRSNRQEAPVPRGVRPFSRPMPAAQPASAATPAAPPAAAPRAAARSLGRFQLRALLSRSSLSMLWLAEGDEGEVHLLLPRTQPTSEAARQAWLGRASRAARLVHPQVAPVLEVGVADGWPFVASARGQGMTLGERLASGESPSPQQAAQWLAEMLPGLAFLHEGGAVHGDVNQHTLLVNEQGRALLMPFGGDDPTALAALGGSGPPEAAGPLAAERAAMDRDVLASGLLLHQMLTGQAALDEKDLPTAVTRVGIEIVRLGWTMRQPVPEPLRAITNRATEREPQRRYVSARSFQRALQGWIDAQSEGGEGFVTQLIERLHRVGHLPGLPALPTRLRAVVGTERLRLDEVAEVILRDPALTFELLRQVNTAQFGNEPEAAVSTVRRAVQLVGLQSLQRTASALKPWPGTLPPGDADALALEVRAALMAAYVARRLCPADMDGEVAYLVALLQCLGPVLLAYHFPEEAAQLRRLVQPTDPSVRPMDESAAAFAVIGVDVETVALAVAKHWGLDEKMRQAMRRVPLAAPVRSPDSRDDMMRLMGSAAIEAVAALSSREARSDGSSAALARVNQRYVRALVLVQGELASAVHQARLAVDATLPRSGAESDDEEED